MRLIIYTVPLEREQLSLRNQVASDGRAGRFLNKVPLVPDKAGGYAAASPGEHSTNPVIRLGHVHAARPLHPSQPPIGVPRVGDGLTSPTRASGHFTVRIIRVGVSSPSHGSRLDLVQVVGNPDIRAHRRICGDRAGQHIAGRIIPEFDERALVREPDRIEGVLPVEDVEFQVAVANNQSGPWTYVGPDGTGNTRFSTSGVTLSGLNGRYCRYKAILSGDGTATPSFGDVHLTFGVAGSNGSSLTEFGYDAAGNMLSRTVTTDSSVSTDGRVYNDLNQLTQRTVGGVTYNYGYNLNGALTSRTGGSGNWTYTFDSEDRLTRVQGPGSVDVSYAYDALGRMLTRTSGSVTTRFVWDQADCIQETTGTTSTNYLVPQGELLSFERSGVIYQVHLDALGSVRMVTDSSGNVTARFELGAYGELLPSSFDNVPGGVPYRFIGGLGCRTDLETGLVYMRNRWYDPQLSVFLSADPIGLAGGANSYRYADSRPTDLIDPYGLNPIVAAMVIGAVSSAVVGGAVRWATGQSVFDRQAIGIDLALGATLGGGGAAFSLASSPCKSPFYKALLAG